MRLPVLLGATAVGKTELALAVAPRLDAEIVSADSRQVYRFMDVGTAKPSKEQLSAVRHHMIDIADPDEHLGAGQYGAKARQQIEKILEEEKSPLVVGGSGLYIRALVQGFFPAPPVDLSLRKEILRVATEKGSLFLHRKLREIDPESAERLHPNDLQRISRALEIYEQTGKTISELQKTTGSSRFEPLYIGLSRKRSELFRRIEARVQEMVRTGFLEEVRNLLDMGYSTSLNSFRAVGYREMADHLARRITLEEAIAKTQKNTKAFSRRQRTWFGSMVDIQWLDLSGTEPAKAADEICALVQKHCSLTSPLSDEKT